MQSTKLPRSFDSRLRSDFFDNEAGEMPMDRKSSEGEADDEYGLKYLERKCYQLLGGLLRLTRAEDEEQRRQLVTLSSSSTFSSLATPECTSGHSQFQQQYQSLNSSGKHTPRSTMNLPPQVIQANLKWVLSICASLLLIGFVAHRYQVDPYEKIEKLFERPSQFYNDSDYKQRMMEIQEGCSFWPDDKCQNQEGSVSIPLVKVATYRSKKFPWSNTIGCYYIFFEFSSSLYTFTHTYVHYIFIFSPIFQVRTKSLSNFGWPQNLSWSIMRDVEVESTGEVSKFKSYLLHMDGTEYAAPCDSYETSVCLEGGTYILYVDGGDGEGGVVDVCGQHVGAGQAISFDAESESCASHFDTPFATYEAKRYVREHVEDEDELEQNLEREKENIENIVHIKNKKSVKQEYHKKASKPLGEISVNTDGDVSVPPLLITDSKILRSVYETKYLDQTKHPITAKDVIKVACVGDSLTYGYGAKEYVHTYPVYLQQMLGKKYAVRNFGEDGVTAQKTVSSNIFQHTYMFVFELYILASLLG